jgi:hypothetical protein
MSEQDSVLLLRRIEQAIYSLEKRLLDTRTQISHTSSEPPVVQFPSVMGVEVSGGTINAQIEDQPIQVVIQEQPIQTTATMATSLISTSVSVSLSSAGNATLLTVPSNAQFRIYQIVISNRSSSVVTFRFRNNSSPPVYYTGLFNLTANALFTLSHLYPFIILDAGSALVIETTTAANLGGCILYQAIL